MLKNQCISVTDLRTNTKECLEALERGEKYIFVNNKPKAVLMDIGDYEEHFAYHRLHPLSETEIKSADRKFMAKVSAMNASEFLNI